MEYITATELLLLLAIFWLPVFAVAAFFQWRFLIGFRGRFAWLLVVFLAEAALAFAIWLSPLHKYFIELDQLGNEFSVGSIPFQAAVLAAVAATFLEWLAIRCRPRSAP